MATTAVKKKTGSMKAQHVVSRVLIYALLIVVAALMLIPFLWMLSASFKLNKDVFTFPIEWIPSNPRPQNYVDIWTKIPLLTFVKNTAFLTIVVTILQVLTSSFAAYAFAKLNFKGKNVLFLGYIATIAVPWQAYMVPQFMMMRSWHLNNTHLAIICLQAFRPSCARLPVSTVCPSTASMPASCCRFLCPLCRRWSSLPSSTRGTTSSDP